MGAGEDSNVARKGATRTIPDTRNTETIGVGETSFELNTFGAGNIDLTGHWVYFRASGGDVTLLRATSSPTIVLGVGFVVKDGETEELYVDAGSELTCYAIASAASTSLIASFDSDA